MKKFLVLFLVAVALICVLFYFLRNYMCERSSVADAELIGTYVMKCRGQIDTLVIKADSTFYHSSHRSGVLQYSTNGTWFATVDGHYELTGYSDALYGNSWDIKPYKGTNSNDVYIPKYADDECMYKKNE